MRAIKAWTDLNCPLWPNYIYRPERITSQTVQTRLIDSRVVHLD